MRFLVLALLASGVLTTPGLAASVLDPMLGSPRDCYKRRYDDAHLAKSPNQRVVEMGLKYNVDYQDPHFELTLELGFTLRNGEQYTITGLCKGNICGAEGDGGSFSLTPIVDGVRLEVDSRRGLGTEGRLDYSGNLYESDDKVFLLYRAGPTACDF